MKRARALKKTKAEQELGRQKDREIHRLRQEIDELSEVVTQQKSDLTRHKIYQQFMERVLDKSDEVWDLNFKYKTTTSLNQIIRY